MKLASLSDGTLDGLPVVVSRDLSRCAPATSIIRTISEALDRWDRVADRLRGLCNRLEAGLEQAWRFHPAQTLAPVPVARRTDGDSLRLRSARSSIPSPRQALVRTRFEGQALAGRDGRPRLVMLTATFDDVPDGHINRDVVACSPVAFTLDALDDAAGSEQPVVGRLSRDRNGEIDDVFQVVRHDLELPASVGKGSVPRLLPIDGLNNLGMIGLRRGDRLLAGVTDCRRRAIAGTIDASLESHNDC